ncbi:unnamed protein product [Brachionus calyciflorus]|uniref:Dynein heavy chain coiled coil stalk domain-containing protein n=1 Tax=Brachionus calyciflorus TaxID=104777 RepID=A0A813TUA2_9BILA|nr:unnamed protein product [Brachionus calyciflorus]
MNRKSKSKGKTMPPEVLSKIRNQTEQEEESYPQQILEQPKFPSRFTEQTSRKNAYFPQQQIQTKGGNYGLEAELASFYNYSEQEEPVINWSAMNENQFEFFRMKDNPDYLKAKKFDFSGLDSLTDFQVYKIIKILLKNHPSQSMIQFDKIMLNGCRNISIWSLHYLIKVIGKSLFDTSSLERINHRVNGCDLITENLMVSLNEDIETKIKSDLKIKNEAKVVIINDDLKKFSLLDFILNEKKNSIKSNGILKYGKLKDTNKSLNIFECSEVLADLFVSERAIIIYAFDSNKPEDILKTNILNFILRTITKNTLPKKIICLAIGKTNTNQSQKLNSDVLNELNKLKDRIKKLIGVYLDSTDEFSFDMQKMLSDHLNLSEQIELIKANIQFISIDLNLNKAGIEQKSEVIMQKLAEVHKNLDKITKDDMYQIKTLKYPPSGLNLVAEAICIMYAKKPSFENFKKLIYEYPNSFIDESLKLFDHTFLSDYDLEKLQSYLKNPDFKPDKINQVSQTGAYLCEWVYVMYDLIKLNSDVFDHMDSSNVANLKENLFSNSCYSFSWQNYLEPDWLNDQSKKAQAIKIQDLIEKMDLKRSRLLTIDDFYRALESNVKLKELLKFEFLAVPDKLIKSNSAKGNYFNSPKNSKFVVSDPKWFADLIESSINSNSNSNDLEHLNDVVGDNVPILTRQFLEKDLANLIPENKASFLKFDI